MSLKQFDFDDDDERYLYEHTTTNCSMKRKRKARMNMQNRTSTRDRHSHHQQWNQDPMSNNIQQNPIQSHASVKRPQSTQSIPSLIKVRSKQSTTIRHLRNEIDQSNNCMSLEHAIHMQSCSEDDEEWDDITINKLLLKDQSNITPLHRYIHHHTA